jgi:membrane protease YdiL (CAAX protease family)
MPDVRIPPTRVGGGQPDISIGQAATLWLGTWLGGQLLAGAVLAASGYTSTNDAPVWVTVVGAACQWAVMIGGLVFISRQRGTGSLVVDFGFSLRPVDLLGIPIGVLAQLVLVRLVTWPFEQAWPGTFSRKAVEKSARDLYQSADGAWKLALVAIVVIGAPLVEELVYRGLLQGAFIRRLNDWLAVVAVAAIFALIHFKPVEYPGLFAFGLVVGICAWRTGRLGLGIITHVAFNATGLALVAR